MKKKFIIMTLAASICLTLGGCGNRQLLDTTYTFNRAIVQLANGTIIDGECESWTDYEYGDMVQVQIDGDTYYIHGSNVSLIKEQ